LFNLLIWSSLALRRFEREIFQITQENTFKKNKLLRD